MSNARVVADPSDLAVMLHRVGFGKMARDESFPVASRLLPQATRPVVLAYYRFARAADDIADSPLLSSDVKLAGLEAVDSALCGRATGPLRDIRAVRAATELRGLLRAYGIPLEHARHLLQAFRKDALQDRYETWSDLLAYCNFSAAPVGRFLLALHREDAALRRQADALCNAHQILNHVQDCKTDFLRLNRVYLPMRWFREEGAEPASLGAASTDPALRRVLDRMLDGAARLVIGARGLPAGLRSPGLRAQAAATLAMANLLLARLRRGDPLRRPVRLGMAAKAWCATAGAVRLLPLAPGRT